jgi:hypothetical protein
MSLRATRAVWKHSEQKGGARLVLLALADVADDDGTAWPSVATLADMTKLTERAVHLALTELVKSGELAVVEQGGGRRRTSRYAVALLDRMGAERVKGLHLFRPETLKSTPEKGEICAGETLKSTTETLKSAPERVKSTTENPEIFSPNPVKNDQLTAANGSGAREGGSPAAAAFDVAQRSITEHPRWHEISSYAIAWSELNTAEGGFPPGFWTPAVVRLLERAVDAFDYDTMERACDWGARQGGKSLHAVIATARRMADDPEPSLAAGPDVDPSARRDGEDFVAWLRRQEIAPPGAMSTGWGRAG